MTSDTPLQPTDFDALDALLDELRTRDDEIPQWEFCEGALAALVCCRRQIPPEEYLPVLLGTGDGSGSTGPFTTPQQAARFMALWQRRWDEVAAALDAKVESLEDKQAYAPEVLDVRGGVAELPEEERAAMAGDELPAFAQVWALGFMFVVENWPEDWAAPRDKEVAEWLDNALSAIVALTEDDTGVPTLSMFSENGPPSLSTERLDVYGTALWAVYDLRELWRTVGPKVQQVRKEAGPGRNDPCHCGSGKKFKKCHGA
ncbi:MAG: UPF0149 family protein [Pseudomonadota bacterium]